MILAVLLGLFGLGVAAFGFGAAWHFHDVRPAVIGLLALLKALWAFSLAFAKPTQEETP